MNESSRWTEEEMETAKKGQDLGCLCILFAFLDLTECPQDGAICAYTFKWILLYFLHFPFNLAKLQSPLHRVSIPISVNTAS